MRIRNALLSALCCCCFSNVSAQSVPDLYSNVRADWHLAGLSEAISDWKAAEAAYNRVLNDVQPLPLHVREWFRGTAGYGIARCAARRSDAATTQIAVQYAYQHHFWNAGLFRNDSTVLANCGARMLDSLADFWLRIKSSEQVTWHDQPPYVWFPKGYDSTDHWPLVIAMHGGNGNYENFSQYWKYISELLNVVVVVPPGVIRESEITNSWGSNMDLIEPSILQIAQNLAAKHLVNPKEIYLTGFSQGGQASIELTLRHPELFRGAISMAGFSAQTFSVESLDRAKRRGIRIYAINGEYDDPIFLQQIQNVGRQCLAGGVPFEFSFVKGMIHEVPLDLNQRFPAAWKWLRNGSETQVQEQR